MSFYVSQLNQDKIELQNSLQSVQVKMDQETVENIKLKAEIEDARKEINTLKWNIHEKNECIEKMYLEIKKRDRKILLLNRVS